MKSLIKKLSKLDIFNNVEKSSIIDMLTCLNTQHIGYVDGDIIIGQGDSIDNIGIIISGCPSVNTRDYLDNYNQVGTLGVGDIYNDCYYFNNAISNCRLVSNGTTEVLQIKVAMLSTACDKGCKCHRTLTDNIIAHIARRSHECSNRLHILSRRTIRDKVITYLSQLAASQDTKYITLPLNRRELAEYINVERSSLSYELCKMRDEGLISFDKNNFVLYNIFTIYYN